MAKESPTPLDRGPGSQAPAFNAPSVAVSTPGRQLQAAPTEFERFRDAVITAGQGVASAVSARAAIRSRLKTLKEQSVQRVESDLRRSALHLQERRFESADRARQGILEEAQTKGMDWATRQFRTRMLNASSTQEARLWESAWSAAASQAEKQARAEGLTSDREAEMARKQQFNAAARTMETVSLSLQQELKEDPELSATLIGDGRGIGARVQDWMLEEIGQELDLDSMTEEDADVLIHQAVKQSFRITDSLTDTYIKRVESSNESLGVRQLESDMFTTMQGEQPTADLEDQINSTLRERLNHLTPEQQQDHIRKSVQRQLIAMSNGDYGIDVLESVSRAKEMLGMKIDGVPLYSDSEKRAITTEMMNRASRTAAKGLEADIAEAMQRDTDLVTSLDGSITRHPSERKYSDLVSPLPGQDGKTAIDDMADNRLRDMGLLDRTDLSPEETLLVQAVRETANKAKQSAVQNALRVNAANHNFNAVMTGDTGGNPDEAAKTSPFRRATMGPAGLSASKLEPLTGGEVEAVREAMIRFADSQGLDPTAAKNWDGSTVLPNDDNQALTTLLAGAEASVWSNEKTQAAYGMPSALVKERLNDLTSQDSNVVQRGISFITSLSPGLRTGWDNALMASGLSQQEIAAAQWVRTVHRKQQGEDQIRLDTAQTMLGVQNILRGKKVDTWLAQPAQEDATLTEVGKMAAIIAGHMVEEADTTEGLDISFDEDRNILPQIEEMFTGDSDNMGRLIKDLWFAGNHANPDMPDDQIGSQVWAWIKREGFRFREMTDDRTSVIIDPHGYSGPSGVTAKEYIESTFVRPLRPEFRVFLQEALAIEQPVNVPSTVQGLFMFGNDKFGQFDEPRSGILIPTPLAGEQAGQRMTKRINQYGGLMIQAQTPEGEFLPLPVTKVDATLMWPDGTSQLIKAGTALNVINPAIFERGPRAVPAPTPSVNASFVVPDPGSIGGQRATPRTGLENRPFN